MRVLNKILFVSLCIFCLAGCDYTSKKIAKEQLKGKQIQSYLGGNLKLIYAENSEGMLNIGNQLSKNQKSIIFRIFVTILLLSIFVYTILKRRIKKITIAALILILGGGIGNLMDRIMNEGKVIDFIVIGFSKLHTGIFNLADFYITTGVIIFIISEIILKKHSSEIAI